MSENRVANFIKNIKSLIKSLAKYPNISWHSIGSEAINVENKFPSIINHPYHVSETTIGYGTAIGKNSYISLTKIGNFCSIGPNVICGWGIHPLSGVSINPAFYSTKKQNSFTFSKTDKFTERKSIEIGSDVFIGANVTILDGVTIGHGAVIGAGAVVSKDIPPFAIAVGCPIQIMRYRFDPNIIDELLDISWWDKEENMLKLVESEFSNVESFIEKAKNLLKSNHIANA
jgi:virginiamycin A acetyltransferase